MKRKTAVLYDPYLDVLGGGERYVLSILKVLEEAGYSIDVLWPTDLASDISQKLHIQFNSLHFKPIQFTQASFFTKIQMLKEYDICLYVTDGSYFVSTAGKTFIYCMVPNPKLYTRHLINKLKTINSIFITHSKYTQKWLGSWGINALLLYPYIDEDFILKSELLLKKEPIILSVGRFFKHLHSKRQDVAIELFQQYKLSNPRASQYRLILAGGLRREDKEYYDQLKTQASSDPSIEFYPNIAYNDLVSLYKYSQFYWHTAGWQIDEQNNPEAVEHLGISPLEAMAAGCITYCYKAGGPRELIQDGENGFLYSNAEELFQKMDQVITNQDAQTHIIIKAIGFIQNHFTYSVFQENCKEIFIH